MPPAEPKVKTILQQSLDKQRIVVTGSRGTSTLTAMLIHSLNYFKRSFDYTIGSPVHGIVETTRLSKDAPLIIIEADVLQMSHYHHHIGLITNIMWNEPGEFKSEEEYARQFDTFADSTPKGGVLLYCENDALGLLIGAKPRPDVLGIGYTIHPHTSESGKHFLTTGKERVPVNIFGSQNFQNISGAKELLRRIGITQEMFYEAISRFE